MPLFQPAVREKIKLRAALDGPTGSGKTWTAAQLARILVGPAGTVSVLDTENDSALRYAPSPKELAAGIERVNWWDPPYEFGHRTADPPYNPVALAQFIDAASEQIGADGVLIVDSLTHYWTGVGGTLDIVDKAKLKGANAFTAWAEGTPAQRYLLDRMIRCKCHLIVTMRSKMEYALEESTDSKGNRKSRVTKLGMQPEQRPGIEYEFDIVASMDIQNNLVISKSRIPNLMGHVAEAGRSHEVAVQLRDWLAEGAEAITAEQAAVLTEALNSVRDDKARSHLKQDFVKVWGHPERVLDVQAVAAAEWIAKQIADLGELPAPRPQGALADALAENGDG
jgi:hypothetical protein